MHVQDGLRRRRLVGAGRQCAGKGGGHGMSYRSQLQSDQVVELVAPVGGRGEPEPAAGRDLFDGVCEPGRGNVVAFVDDDEAVIGGENGDVVAAGEGLQHRHVYGAADLRATATELAR